MRKLFYICLSTSVLFSVSVWAQQVEKPVSSSHVHSLAEKVHDQWYGSLRQIFTQYNQASYYGPNRHLISQLESKVEPLSNELAGHLYDYGALHAKAVIQEFLSGGNVNNIEGFLDQECNVQQLMAHKSLCESSLIRYAHTISKGVSTTLSLEHADFYTPCVKVGTMATCIEFVQQAGRAYILDTTK